MIMKMIMETEMITGDNGRGEMIIDDNDGRNSIRDNDGEAIMGKNNNGGK